jgi:serine phosphatase RsbU (regulator of sigma subunit)
MTMMRLEDPGRTLEEVNHQLCVQMFNGQFVTLLIVMLDLHRGEMSMATAGHYPPLMREGNQFVPVPLAPQLVLGVEKDVQFPTQRFDLPASSTLLLYTDGVLDVQDPAGERFCLDNLEGSLHGPFASAQEVIDQVVASIAAFRGSRDLPDDLTMVAIQLQPQMAGRELAGAPA